MVTVGELGTRGTMAIPEPATLRRSPNPDVDAAVTAVAARKDAWVATGVEDRIALLERIMRDTRAVAPRWVEVECARKHIPADGAIAGEEWFAGPSIVVRNARLLRDSLRDIARHGAPRLPGQVRTRADGRVVAPVFPTNAFDRLVYLGFSGEVWMQPGVAAEDVGATVGGIYRSGVPRRGGVCAVLGAGNVSAIPATDVLHKAFAEDRVVVLKLSPLTQTLGPVLLEALGALADAGFLRIVYGGAAEAEHLIQHRLVDAVHMTGSDKTHDAVVFGAGAEGQARKAAGTPLLAKPITSELGSVTPVIVVPGPWSSASVAYEAEHLATGIAHNGGFNCVATRVLVTGRGWDRRDDLIAALGTVLRGLPNRYAYYPGAEDRLAGFVAEHRDAQRMGGGAAGSLPWTLLTGVDPADAVDVCTVDAFAPVTTEVTLDARSPADFLDRAVEFCNERLWGTLGASIVVHPASLRDDATRAALRRAEADLRYGSVVVNHWSGAAFGLVSPPWGAFPGSRPADIGSGRGVVHNTYLYTRPEKTVLRAPFRSRPTPPWFVTHGRGREALAANVDLEATQDPRVLPRLVYSAVRG